MHCYKNALFWTALVAVVACIVFVVCYFTARTEKAENNYNVTIIDENASQLTDDNLLGATTSSLSIAFITDPTKNEDVSYDTTLEKFYEDQDYEYFFGGTYSKYIIVHYADSTQENIVTALSAGRATLSDLDRFGICYLAEVKKDALSQEITNAIIRANRSEERTNAFSCASFVLLKQENLYDGDDASVPDQIVVYGLARYQSFGISHNAVHAADGTDSPAIITFEVEDGKYTVKTYWVPRDGSYYAQDIHDNFPDDIETDVLNAQKYALVLTQDCYTQAVQYGNIDVDRAVEHLFETIEYSPASSSSPEDYMNAYPSEFQELTYYGNYTLNFIFSRFLEGNQTGLRGELMRAVLDVLAPEAKLLLVAETGQDYFEAWKDNAIYVQEQNDMEWIKENQPAIFLFLQMI